MKTPTLRFELNRETDAPAELLVGRLMDLPGWGRWNPFVRELRAPGPAAPGLGFEVLTRPLPLTFGGVVDRLEHPDPQHLSMTFDHPSRWGLKVRVDYEVWPQEGARTRTRIRLSAFVQGWPLLLAVGLFRHYAERLVKRLVEDL